jgi:hypothetical protein
MALKKALGLCTCLGPRETHGEKAKTAKKTQPGPGISPHTPGKRAQGKNKPSTGFLTGQEQHCAGSNHFTTPLSATGENNKNSFNTILLIFSSFCERGWSVLPSRVDEVS